MSTLVMSLGMISFFVVVMTVAWLRYQRHATKAAGRSRAAMVQLLTDSGAFDAQSGGANSSEGHKDGAQENESADVTTTSVDGVDGFNARDAEAFEALVENFHSDARDER